MGSKWCPEEIEIFFNCKFANNKIFSFASSYFMGNQISLITFISNFMLDFQKYGQEWDIVLTALHEDEFSHRTVKHVVAFYE